MVALRAIHAERRGIGFACRTDKDVVVLDERFPLLVGRDLERGDGIALGAAAAAAGALPLLRIEVRGWIEQVGIVLGRVRHVSRLGTAAPAASASSSGRSAGFLTRRIRQRTLPGSRGSGEPNR